MIKLKCMITIDPKSIETPKLQGYLQGSVGPRPIAFASTMDVKGNPNLSPFSFLMFLALILPYLYFHLQDEFVTTQLSILLLMLKQPAKS